MSGELAKLIGGPVTEKHIENWRSVAHKSYGYEGLMVQVRALNDKAQVAELRGLIKGFNGDDFMAQEVVVGLDKVVETTYEGDISVLLSFEEIRTCITHVLKKYGI